MKVVETERLILCRLSVGDAAFILELLNDPAFLRFVGDKGVRTLDDARRYLLSGPIASYQRHGFGLYLTKLKDGDISIGICGLLKRESLDDVDVGFAFLPPFRRQGYGFESASAVIGHGRAVLGLDRIVAVTQPDNVGSIHLLEKLGLHFERMVKVSDDGQECKLFVSHP
ncbi:MAG: GNAT family N-acetyltransferase [Proteobacteria bacterium]|nr:GNAT family N-acetyltransferase [Pseudomonadota bacterium]